MSGTSSPTMFSGDFADDECLSENWPDLEFRTPADEAWYDVEVWTQYKALVISFKGFTSEYNELYPLDDFKNLEELKEFEERFRASYVQMQDLQCPEVVEGTRVCAKAPSEADEVKFYNAVVVEVERVNHDWNQEKEMEVCGCTFELYWTQGPWIDQITYAKAADICLKPEDDRLNPTVVKFLEEVKRHLNGVASSSGQGGESEWQQTLNRVNSALRNYDRNRD